MRVSRRSHFERGEEGLVESRTGEGERRGRRGQSALAFVPRSLFRSRELVVDTKPHAKSPFDVLMISSVLRTKRRESLGEGRTSCIMKFTLRRFSLPVHSFQLSSSSNPKVSAYLPASMSPSGEYRVSIEVGEGRRKGGMVVRREGRIELGFWRLRDDPLLLPSSSRRPKLSGQNSYIEESLD